MKDTEPTSSQAWRQTALSDPPVQELLLRVGVVPASDHCQAQLELRSGTDGALLAMQSWPAFRAAVAADRASEILRAWQALYDEITQPFPDLYGDSGTV